MDVYVPEATYFVTRLKQFDQGPSCPVQLIQTIGQNEHPAVAREEPRCHAFRSGRHRSHDLYTGQSLDSHQGIKHLADRELLVLDALEHIIIAGCRRHRVERLLGIVKPYLPEQPWIYAEDALTDRSDRFLAAEIVREKLCRLTGDELPYTSTVVIDKYEEEGELRRIAATIVVEREAHKGMIIGSGGERLKRIGSEARQELEHLLDARVFLELWVKVKSGWADDEAHLRSYGYD